MKQSKLKIWIFGTVLAGFLGLGIQQSLQASDHDDGEMDLKGRSLNLTDLYAFREDWQDSAGSSSNLVLVMNTNPRSMARQQYYFSTQARYEFHLSRVAAANKTVAPNGNDDVMIGFEFSAPKANGRQSITMTVIKDGGAAQQYSMGETTTIADNNLNQIVTNNISIGGQNLSVFAGLREDPFYFDVERYFRIRGLLATGTNTLTGAGLFRDAATAVDFTAGYNVNAIVLRVPIQFLQQNGEPVFDIWETISVKQ